MEEQTRELFSRSVKALTSGGGVADLNALDVWLWLFVLACSWTLVRVLTLGVLQTDTTYLPFRRPFQKVYESEL